MDRPVNVSSGSLLCTQRLFVYDYVFNFTNVYRKHTFSRGIRRPPVLDSFGHANTYTFTAEVPIYDRLLERCPRTTDPARADWYVVPAWLGTAIASGWAARRPAGAKNIVNTVLRGQLPHLSSGTARKHLFFCTVDSQFVIANNVTRHALWIHLGDDTTTGRITAPKFRLTQTIVVPYRLTQWLTTLPSIQSAGRDIFLFGNTNLKRHTGRKLLKTSIEKESTNVSALNILIVSEMLPPSVASHIMSRSLFCLCPTGDSKGFTARFYFALVHGCLPVWVDTYQRRLAHLALPYGTRIQWDRLMVIHEMNQPVIPRLLRIRPDYRYMRDVQHMLMYDLPRNAGPDAADIAVEEILNRSARTKMWKA